ncbi:MAG: PorT family protein, partial [Leadbetterella sp.]|nr:PorT family protein [Leadbetterella sp.]
MQSLRVLVLFLLTLPAMAQIEPRLFEFGPKAGVNLSTVSPSDTITYSKTMAFGLQGGIFTRFNFGKFSLQPEFIYQAKGANIKKPVAAKQ